MFTYLIIFLFVGVVSAKSGKRHPMLPDAAHRIVGGENAKIRDFPWQVSLQLDGQHYCGGSIISKDWVLTIASCLRSKNVQIRSGSTYWFKGGTLQDAQEVIVHPSYNTGSPDNDAALIRVGKPFSKESVIELYKENEHISSGSAVNVTGWGLTEEEGGHPGEIPCTLQKVEIAIVCNKICKEIYGPVFTPNMICAGTDEGDQFANVGDCGGPLVHNNRLVGLVGFTLVPEELKLPSIYTKVSAPSIRSFIRKYTNL